MLMPRRLILMHHLPTVHPIYYIKVKVLPPFLISALLLIPIFYRWTYIYSLRYRNSTTWTTANNKLHVVWGSAGSFNDLGGYLSNSGGDPSTTQLPVNIFTGATPAVYVSFRSGLNLTSAATAPGIINVDGTNGFSYPTNSNICNFRTTLAPKGVTTAVYDAAGQATLEKNTQFNSYDYDIRNTGTLAMTPNPTLTSDQVCLGTNAAVRFNDTSVFNCIGNGTNIPTPTQGAANSPINNNTRWIRIIYGGANSATPANVIPNVVVGGTPVTGPSGALLPAWASNPVLPGSYTDMAPNGAPMAQGYVKVGAAGPPIGSPDQNGVIQINIPAGSTGSGLISDLITTSSPTGQVVGQKFYVTLQYWGVCNPYVAGAGSAPVEISLDWVEIVDRPLPPTVPVAVLCETTANATSYTATGAAGATFNWYKDAALTQFLFTGATFNPFTQGPSVDQINPAVTGSTTFHRYVTQTVTGVITCTSLAKDVVIQIDDSNTGGTIAHPLGASPITICNTTDPAAFTSSIAGVGGGAGGTFTYQWQNATTSGGTYSDISGATSATYDPSIADIAAGRFFKRRVRSGTCADAFSNIMEFVLNTTATPGSIDGTQTICISPGNPAILNSLTPGAGGTGTPGYQWQSSTVGGGVGFTNVGVTTASYDPPAGLLTTTFYRRQNTSGICPTNVVYTNEVKVTVENLVTAGAIGADQTICSGDTPVGLTGSAASGGDGATYFYAWEQSTTSAVAGFGAASGINNTQNYTPGARTATTWYRRIATSGALKCAAATSNVIQVLVNPLPTAQNPTGGGSVCSGNPAPNIVWNLPTGSPNFTISYTITKNPGAVVTPVGPITGITTNSFTIVNPLPVGSAGDTFDYKLTSIVDGNGCPANAVTLAAVLARRVTIGGTAPSFDTAPTLDIINACNNATPASIADPTLLFSLDAGSANSAPPHFTLTYKVDGSANRTKVFATNGAGDPTAPIVFTSDAELNTLTPSPHVITLVSLLSPGGCQTILTNTLNFTVRPLPSITTQPAATTTCDLSNASFTVVAGTAPNLSYQWQEKVGAGAFTDITDGGIYGGATTTTLALTGTPVAMNGNQYRVVVTGYNTPSATPLCPVTSNAATLTVRTLPNITTQPANVTTCNASNATFSVVSGGTNLSFQWQEKVGAGAFTNISNGGVYGGATSANLVLTGVTLAMSTNQYRVIVTGYNSPSSAPLCPVTSNVGTLTVKPLPAVTVPPANAIVCDLLNTSFSVTATGTDLSYQWQEKVGAGAFTNLSNAGVYSGVTTTTLTLTGVPVSMNTNQYRVVVTGYNAPSTPPLCPVNSASATLTVNPLPAAAAQTPAVCSDAPGGTTHVQDLTIFNTAVNAGAGTTTTVTWWTGYIAATKTFTGPIMPGPGVGQDKQYTLSSGVIHARVEDNTTNCVSHTTATYTVKPKPFDNEIRDGTGATIATVATSPRAYSLCASNSSILFQTNGTLNPSSTFAWSVPAPTYAGEFVLVTASANIIVMRFPNATESPATSNFNGGIPITVTETLNGCAGNPVTIMVHVLAAPAPSVIAGDASVCDGGIAHYSVIVPVGGSTYSWGLPPGATITSLPVNADNITVQMSSFSGNVTVVSSNGTCVSPAAAPFPVAVVPRPTFTRTVTDICSGQNVNAGVTLTPSIAGSTFNWELLSIAGSITGVAVGNTGTEQPDINQTPLNVSGIAGTITYRVTPVGPAPIKCTGPPQTFAVTVNPEPVLSLTNKPLCAGEAANYRIELIPSGLPSNTTFTWGLPLMSDGSTQGSTSGGSVPLGSAPTPHINDSFVNTTGLPITARYTIVANASGCVSSQPLAARQVTFTINPSPVGPSPAPGAAQCSNVPFTVSSNAITNFVPSTFTWVRNGLPGGLTQVTAGTGTGDISETLRNLTSGQLSATYVVTPKSLALCVGAPYTITIPIDPEPVGGSVTSAAQCSSQTFNVSANNISNLVASTFTWVRNALPIGLNEITAGTPGGNISENLQNVTGVPAKCNLCCNTYFSHWLRWSSLYSYNTNKP